MLMLAIIVAGGMAVFSWTLLFKTGHYASDSDRAITVNAGESYISVVMRLERRGIVPSAMALQLYAKVSGVGSAIQKGSYIIPEGLSPVDVVRYLSSGHQNLIKVTVPEGETMRQVAAIFGETGIVSRDDFLAAATDEDLMRRLGIPDKTAEGYLFPETYYFAADYPADKVVGYMVQTFFDELKAIYPDYESLGEEELQRYVTLASIVEREYLDPAEAPLIASVFENRIKKGMRLESCATVVYVMTEIDGLQHPSRLFYEDLNRPSEYNTYLHAGLPPAPISSPGRISLDAAFHPADTNYLFFVLTAPNAEHHVFSTNYQDHLSASQVYYFKLN